MGRNQVNNTNDHWQSSVARSVEEVKAIRPIWQEMQHNQPHPIPNSDIDRYLSILESQKEQMQPYIILFRQKGKPVAIVVARLENHQLKCKIGYKVVLNPSLRCLTVVYGGVLGNLNENTCAMVIKHLQSVLRIGEADMVFFNQLKTDAPMYRTARKIPTLCCRSHFPVLNAHWKAFLPNSFEEFLHSRSKNTRHNIRRYSKRLVCKYSERLSIKCFTAANQIDQLFKDTVEVAEKTYQHGLAMAFVDDIKTRRLINFFVDHKWLIAYLLYIDGKPCAFWHGIRYGKTFFTLVTGYDPAYYNDRLGLFLLVKMCEALCLKENVDAIDFGFGDAQYKESFCDVSWMEASVYIFAPRLYPVTVNLLHSAAAGLFLGLNRLTDKAGFTRWLKRHWRNSLQVAKDNKHKTEADKS